MTDCRKDGDAVRIDLWYDKTSDCDNPVWCVSLCNDDGDEIRCLSTYERLESALVAADREADARNLPLVVYDKQGNMSLVDSRLVQNVQD